MDGKRRKRKVGRMRLIDADAYLESIRPRGISDELWENCEEYKRVMSFPTVETEWIPSGEELPKYRTTVLVTNDKGNVRCGRFRGVEFYGDDGDEYWLFKGNTIEHVLAWMPLPKPFRREV